MPALLDSLGVVRTGGSRADLKFGPGQCLLLEDALSYLELEGDQSGHLQLESV